MPADAAAGAGLPAAVGVVVLLVLTLLTLVLLGLTYIRVAGRGPEPAGSPQGIPGGVSLAALGGLLFLVTTAAVLYLEPVRAADQALLDALGASLAGFWYGIFGAVTLLGDTVTCWILGIAVVVVLLALHHFRLAAVWSVGMAGSGLINLALKHAFERERPVKEHPVVLEDSWSFPSGHTSGAMVTYGLLAWLLLQLLPSRWHRPVQIAALCLPLAVGASRVLLQVHFPTDVLGGYAWSAAWLVLCVHYGGRAAAARG